MNIEKIAAFSFNNKGGNPAGVVFSQETLSEKKMLEIAKKLNYSETAFLTKQNDSFRLRFFSPETEVAFCGHATIASGRVLDEKFPQKEYSLILNDGTINLKVEKKNQEPFVSFYSLNTFTKDIDFNTAKELLDIFNIKVEDLDERFPIKISNSGNNHPIIFLKERKKLSDMKYDFDRAKKFMEKENFVTVSLLFCENESFYHSRNAFAFGGVYEDPATGSAAVALAEYLRNIKYKTDGEIRVIQGEDMNVPCEIFATYTNKENSPIKISGFTRKI